MVNISTIFTAMECLGILIGVAIAIVQLRNINKTTQAELFMQLYHQFHNTEFMRQNIDIMMLEWKDFEDYWSKYGLNINPEATTMIYSVGNFFEGIGVLVNKNLIDLELVDDLMSGLALRYWEKLGPIIEKQREIFNWPEAYEWTEYLYNKIKSIAENERSLPNKQR